MFNSSPFNSVAFNASVLASAPTDPVDPVDPVETIVVELADGVRWRLRVILAGVDVSDRLTGRVSVDREEGGARMLKLSLLPTAGPFDIDTLTGKPVTLYRQRIDGDTMANETLRFSGETLRPGIDAATKVVSITASCGLQRRVELMSIEAIKAMLPGGFWSVSAFGELEKHWQYCQDRCSTMPGNLDSAPDGSLRWTPWKAAAVPHFSFGPDEIVDGSMSLQPADASQLINKVEVVVEYRYVRLRHRGHVIVWEHPAGSFCVWFALTTELPTRSMLLDALEQGGWAVIGTPGMEELPPSMADPCGTGFVWVNRNTADPLLLSFNASVAKRTSQTITERYTFTLTADGSVSAFGVQPSRERYSDDVEFDTSSWVDIAPTDAPAGAIEDDAGDLVLDKDQIGRRDDAVLTALHLERTRMLGSHRLARYQFQTAITDEVYDTTHTVRAEANRVTVQGKVTRVQEAWDIDNGSEVATIELALSRGGDEVTETPITVPARPVFDLGPAPSNSTVLATQLGGLVGSAPYDEELPSFSGNYSWAAEFEEVYPRRLQFDTPAVEGKYRDPVEADSAAAFRVSIPTDLLIMEVA